MPTTSTRTVRRGAAAPLVALALAVAFAFALVACGGSSGDDKAADVATLDKGAKGQGDGKGKGSKEPKELTAAEREDAMVDYSKCMRKNGVDMQDPTSVGGSGKGGVAIAVPAGGPGVSAGSVTDGRLGGSDKEAKKFEKADKACGSILKDVFGEAPELSPEEEAEMRDNALKFAKCMRKHGVDMPDPTFDGDGGSTIALGPAGGSGKGGGPKPSDKVFEKAQEACAKVLGNSSNGGFTATARVGS